MNNSKQKIKILIVEDEAITGIYVKNMLKRRGYIVTSLETSGESAVLSAGADKPDLVLMDIKLSGVMDGIDAAKYILDKFSIPVIFLTAQSNSAIFEKLNTNKPFECLFKPYTERELDKIISDTLNKIKPNE
ncbi:MAG: response regulator [Nitrospirae bacterium]|nr:response regulator [Nitrospirota bacterium]